MSKTDPVEKLIDLIARLIARAHLRHCSSRVQPPSVQSDAPPASSTSEADDSSSNECQSDREDESR